MAHVHLHLPSFNAGELSPLLGARFAVEKVQAGCRRLRNFIPHVHGPVFRRPGMEFMGLAQGGKKSNLRGFNFSTTTGFILEFSEGHLRFWSNGQLVRRGQDVLDLATPYNEAECAELQMAQVNDVCYLAHPNHPPRKLTRFADDDWRLGDIPWKWPALGDENVRTAEIPAPIVTKLGEVFTQEWPEFKMNGTAAYTFSVEGVTLDAKAKSVKLWQWKEAAKPENSEWILRKKINWTNHAPDPVHGTVSGAAGTSSSWRITYNEPGTTDGTAHVTVGGADVSSLDLTPDHRASLQSTSVPAGDWQMTVECGDTIPPGARLNVQQKKRVKGKDEWVQFLAFPLQAGKVVNVPGNTLKEAAEFRFVWSSKYSKAPKEAGRAMYLADGTPGLARFERTAFPASADLSLAVNGTNGTGKVLTATSLTLLGCDTTNGTAVACESTVGLAPGALLDGPGLAPDTTVLAVADDHTFTISAEPLAPGTGLTLKVLDPIFQPGHIGSFWEIVHRREGDGAELIADAPDIVAKSSDSQRVNGTWEVFTYGIWNATLYLERKVNGTWEVVRAWTSRKDRNVVANGVEDGEAEMRLRISAGSATAQGGELARPRFVLETADARVTGLVKVTDVTPLASGKSPTATVDIITPLYSTAATPLWTEGAFSPLRGYPRTVALHGQRLWFGGTRREPMRLWGSVVNDYEDFRRTSLDDGGVSFVPAAQQSNPLQWMASYGETLVLGTNGDEWTVSGGTDRGPITPVSVHIQRRSGYGSRYLPALLIGDSIAFVQRGGHKLRSVAPQQDGLAWMAADLTVLAEHVARAGVGQTAAMHFPETILWAVTADGQLLGVTFEQEQNVFAWHVHETQGQVESVAVVFGLESDEVWLAVQREGRRMIERLDARALARQFDDPQRLIYLDAAQRFESASGLETLAGLEHLEGCTVVVLGDGAEILTATVNGGTLSLAGAAPKVAIVGLRYTSELQPMRVEIPLPDGTAQHRQWRTSRVGLYLHDSQGGTVADGPEAREVELNYRQVQTPTETPPPPYTGEIETALESRARTGVDVVVRTDKALPFNVGSVTLKGDVYGE